MGLKHKLSRDAQMKDMNSGLAWGLKVKRVKYSVNCIEIGLSRGHMMGIIC